jgi:raffinose/stachyose/melibiose transport system permease protein
MSTTLHQRAAQAERPSRPPPPPRRTSVGRTLWWFALPALVFYVGIVLAPTLQGAFMSFTDWNAFQSGWHYIGLDNYRGIFDANTAPILWRTLLLAIVTVVVQNVLGLALALALNSRVVGRNVLRTIIFAPVVVSPLVCGYLFQYVFGSQGVGALNEVLDRLGFEQHDFLGQPGSALWVVIVVVCWQFTGSAMVIYLAGLQGVPAELVEAAALDGAGAVRRFWYVVRPLLAPAITINLMLGLIGGLKIFDQIFATTSGGPAGQTETVSTQIYKLFSTNGTYGMSAALAVVLALGVSVLALVQFTIIRRQERTS